ncbi:MAG TPA: universal stress protein [Pseudonocardia sp.]|jgi:nucleotide-binding universal stress UspA family protein
MGSTEVVVVGVNSDTESGSTLCFAVQEACRRNALLRVVSAFESSGVFGTRYGLPIPVSDDEISAKIEVQTEALVMKAMADAPHQVPVEVVVRAGSTGWVLTEESKRADLLIVGHADVMSVLFGSVGLHCVLHAHCPVTVVRPVEARLGGEKEEDEVSTS